MKYIKYQINNRVNIGTEDSPNWIDNLFQKSIIYTEVNEKIAKSEAHNGEYTIEDDGVESTTAEKIAELKKQLSATDYKIIKCAEYQLLGEEIPYDMAALHAERQAIRDEINKLEQAV